jgi:hypothetical protein
VSPIQAFSAAQHATDFENIFEDQKAVKSQCLPLLQLRAVE